jgi:hypothetical protein
MSAKKSTTLRKMPGLMATHADGQWAIVSNDKTTSLTEIEGKQDHSRLSHA